MLKLLMAMSLNKEETPTKKVEKHYYNNVPIHPIAEGKGLFIIKMK